MANLDALSHCRHFCPGHPVLARDYVYKKEKAQQESAYIRVADPAFFNGLPLAKRTGKRMLSFLSKHERDSAKVEAMQKRMSLMDKQLAKKRQKLAQLEAKRAADSASDLESSESDSDADSVD